MAYLRITVKGRRNSRVPLADAEAPVARHDPALVHRDVVEFDAFYFPRVDELQGLLPGDRVLVGRRRRAGAVDTLWRVTAEAEAHAVERIDRHVGARGGRPNTAAAPASWRRVSCSASVHGRRAAARAVIDGMAHPGSCRRDFCTALNTASSGRAMYGVILPLADPGIER